MLVLSTAIPDSHSTATHDNVQSPSMTRKRPGASVSDTPKRARCGRRPDVKNDAFPSWLQDAAAAFVNATPPLNWTGGFYSWGTWLDTLRNQSLWTATHEVQPPWRQLVDACRTSGQVCGTAALYRAKNDLVSAIINLVYRRGETQRLSIAKQKPAAERDIMRRIRAVVTRQRRHESASPTLIRYLDLAFVFSAYKDCRLAQKPKESFAQVSTQVEEELNFLQNKPSAKQTGAVTQRMESYMWQHRWLPWYEQMPHMKDAMLISAREAAHAFCNGLPCPKFGVGTGVRGLSRDHLAGAGIMDEWLLTLFDESISPRWRRLAEVYEEATKDWRGEEGKLLEEISRRVIERILEPLTEMNDSLDSDHCKLVDATPGIVVTQSARIPGRFTFRLLVELHVHLVMFCEYLHKKFHGRLLPSIEDIHPGVLLFDELSRRITEVRTHMDEEKAERLIMSCLRAPELHDPHTHPSQEALQSCKDYQIAAIKAAVGPAVMFACKKPEDLVEAEIVSESDPLMFAAIIAGWDPILAARIVDAAVRIGKKTREQFVSGEGCGLDIYTHRRVLVCDAAIDRCRGDRRAAAEIMMKLEPVWDVCTCDKEIGSFSPDGILLLKLAVERGNFEAATAFGNFIGEEHWEAHRNACGVTRSNEIAIDYLCRGLTAGDVGAARSLIHLLCNQSPSRAESNSETTSFSKKLVEKARESLEVAAKDVPAIALYLGYLHSIGANGLDTDCNSAMGWYKRVLLSNKVNTRFKAHAANNIAVLKALHGSRDDEHEDVRIYHYLRTAAAASNPKASTNLAALTTINTNAGRSDVLSAMKMYKEIFQSCTKESLSVTVIQTNDEQMQLNVMEVKISKDKQDAFCQELKAEGMDLEKYGEVKVRETIPYTIVDEDGVDTGDKSNTV
eukprot:TRINITY_DN295_c0_g1_i1.p1 TRINITY_DN295_c0_g1~~TRINITY_DN295_c0_g1_i1.p1  ORF type:complete len:901 (-),score=105.36 TRINITY_DN295_c0_g1_i1:3479-6181(-)